MKAQICVSDIENITRELARLLPNVKSSHRVEAMARGLGWNTNAALRAELPRLPVERTVDDDAFTSYLKEHGFANTIFDSLGEAVVRCKFADARAAIKAVLDREPTLTRFGFGIFDDPRKSREQRRREFEESRAELLTPHATDEFIQAREFLSHFSRRRTINEKVSSYGLKHQAERFCKDRGDGYVSNGALITAAIHLGFNIRQDGPNAYFNIGGKQDSPLRPAAWGKRLPRPRQRLSTEVARSAASRNMVIGAINAGLDQRIFGLNPDDNRWHGTRAVYRFSFAQMPAIACVGDAGFGELSIQVAVKPTRNAEEWIDVMNPGFRAGDAFAAGWLERRKGKWLQTSAKPICAFRRSILPILAQAHIQPNGYLPEGPFIM